MDGKPALKHCAVFVVGMDVAVDENGASEIGADEVGSSQIDAHQNRVAEIRRMEVCPFERGVDDHGAGKVCPRQRGIAHLGIAETDLSQESAFKVGAVQLARLELGFDDYLAP